MLQPAIIKEITPAKKRASIISAGILIFVRLGFVSASPRSIWRSVPATAINVKKPKTIVAAKQSQETFKAVGSAICFPAGVNFSAKVTVNARSSRSNSNYLGS